MTYKKRQSCIYTIQTLRRLALNIHGVIDVVDDMNCNELIRLLQTEHCDDCISRQAAVSVANDFDATQVVRGLEKLPSVQPEQKVIRCKDCNEWHRGKNRDGSDVYSDEGYCCVHRIITGENYYCGDAERR